MQCIRTCTKSLVVSALLGSAVCAMAQVVVNPNGFPNGPHYNLNIIGKKLDYQCDPTLQVDEYGNTLYGGVIKVPITGTGIQIVMQSGKKGSKLATATELRVLDSCATYFDGDAAVVELPPWEKGYNVYARALATPGGSGTLSYGGSVFSAIDEGGNDLVHLGLIKGGIVGKVGEELIRTRGKPTAVDITRLFQWSGEICNIIYDQTPLTEQPSDPTGYAQVCWIDSNLNQILDLGDSVVKPEECSGGQLVWIQVACTEVTNEWIFNLGDLVISDWLLDNSGSKLIQIRFYPVQ